MSVKRFLITRLPSYLILVINRFKKNNFFLEKNPTIVNFPVQGLDMAAYCTPGMSQTTYDLVRCLLLYVIVLYMCLECVSDCVCMCVCVYVGMASL